MVSTRKPTLKPSKKPIHIPSSRPSYAPSGEPPPVIPKVKGNGGAIGGIIVGVLVVLLIAGLWIRKFLRDRQQKKSNENQALSNQEDDYEAFIGSSNSNNSKDSKLPQYVQLSKTVSPIHQLTSDVDGNVARALIASDKSIDQTSNTNNKSYNNFSSVTNPLHSSNIIDINESSNNDSTATTETRDLMTAPSLLNGSDTNSEKCLSNQVKYMYGGELLVVHDQHRPLSLSNSNSRNSSREGSRSNSPLTGRRGSLMPPYGATASSTAVNNSNNNSLATGGIAAVSGAHTLSLSSPTAAVAATAPMAVIMNPLHSAAGDQSSKERDMEDKVEDRDDIAIISTNTTSSAVGKATKATPPVPPTNRRMSVAVGSSSSSPSSSQALSRSILAGGSNSRASSPTRLRISATSHDDINATGVNTDMAVNDNNSNNDSPADSIPSSRPRSRSIDKGRHS